MKKFLFVIIDGGAENCAQNRQTTRSSLHRSATSAFAAAKKPNIDFLAANSACGSWTGPHAPHYNPRSLSSVAMLEILGYSWRDEPGRGYLEALGAELKINKKSVYVRGNFAYVKDEKRGASGRKIVDRRAGRDETGLDILVNELNKDIRCIGGVKTKLYRLVGHRVVLVLSGSGLSKHVTDGDIRSSPVKIKPLNPKARKTAYIVNKYLEKSSHILSAHPINKKRKFPANFLLLRSAGSYKKVKSFGRKFGMKAASISGVNIIRGTSRYLGINVIDAPLSQLENDLPARAKKAIDALERYDFVILHINGADTYAHNKDLRGKVGYIEKIDKEVFSQVIKIRHINIGVICDHITDSRSGEHVFGPVPFLLYVCNEENESRGFDESCRDFVADNPMKKILSVIP